MEALSIRRSSLADPLRETFRLSFDLKAVESCASADLAI